MAQSIDYAKVLNIPSNAVLPFNPMRTKLAIGSAEYVAIEVIVDKLLRKLMRFRNKSFMELAYIHAVSLSFMGGASAFAGAAGDYDANLTQQIKDGAKGIPAVLLAKWVVDTCYRGFHTPFTKWDMGDIAISAASKTLSRPLFSLLYPYVKKVPALAEPLQINNEMIRRQANRGMLAGS